jgi:hypothetical protein
MMIDYTIQFYFAVAAGLAIGLAGLVNVLAPRLLWPGRLGLTAVAAGLPIAGLALLQNDSRLTLSAVGVVTGLLLVVGVAGSKPIVAIAARPAVRWAGLAVVGLAVVLGSGVWYERALDADAEDKIHEMELAESQPPLEVVATAAVTDHGHAVEVKRATATRPPDGTATLDESRLRTRNLLLSAIRLAPADDVSNCHGWVFTGGRYWVTGKQVDPIIAENGYYHVLAPAVGDLVVYRDPAGNVTHSAIVLALPDGLAPLVESKWGCLGVFLHPVDKSPYGMDFTFYRSPRIGHLLAGLATPATPGKVLLP